MKKFTILSVLFLALAFGASAQVIVDSTIYEARITTAGGLTGTTPVDSGMIIQVHGTVYGPNSYPTQNGMAFWLNDGTAGIKIYSKHVYGYYLTLTDGDQITVVGTLTDYYGSAEIDLFDSVALDTIYKTASGTPDTPIVTAFANFSPQTYGTLVQVDNVNMTGATGWGSTTKHYFTCNANGVYLYVDSFTSAALFHWPQPTGVYNVVGIGDDYSPNEFNLDPRDTNDFHPVGSTMGINAIAGLTAIVYPNPASTQLNVSFGSEIFQPVICKMYDVTGKQVLAETSNAAAGVNTISLNTASLASGLYVLDVRLGEKALVTKISIVK